VSVALRITRDGPRLTLTLAEPARRNPQRPALWSALADLAEGLDPAVRVVVLNAEGPSFSTGLDLAVLSGDLIAGEPDIVGAAARSPQEAASLIEPLQRGFSRWALVPAVVVAAVQGHAVGAGFQLALAADIRLVADDVRLSMAEVSLGLVPDLGGTASLVAAVGYSRALELCATGRAMGAGEAVACGLAAAAVPPGQLAEATDDLVAALLAAPPEALRELKPLLRAAGGASAQEQLGREREAQARLLHAMATRRR
jgi:enoyl-CoA hydratase/carnithine racemase